MEKALKKSICNLQKNAENMSDKDFRKQGYSVLGELTNIVQKAMEEGEVASQHFFNGVNKEIDILSKMIDSPEYTPAQKVDFSKRFAKLVDKLQKKDIVKELAIFASLGLLGVTIWQFITHRK
ncbi:MAG: hypothetical protein E7354_03335 [Clostridiales bacterium]|nr:hypothetical protein [Clostridiales bacterium]